MVHPDDASKIGLIMMCAILIFAVGLLFWSALVIIAAFLTFVFGLFRARQLGHHINEEMKNAERQDEQK